MTENDSGTPRDPQRDPETPPTQPMPGSTQPVPESFGAEPAGSGSADPGRTESFEQPGATQPYGQAGMDTPYEQQGSPAAYGPPGAPAAPQYGYAPPLPKNDLGVWALVTGILSYVMCPLLLGIAAIITGTMSRRAADEGLANNRGMGTAGLVLGWVNVALSILGIVFFVFVLGAGLIAGGFSEWSDVNDMSGY